MMMAARTVTHNEYYGTPPHDSWGRVENSNNVHQLVMYENFPTWKFSDIPCTIHCYILQINFKKSKSIHKNKTVFMQKLCKLVC